MKLVSMKRVGACLLFCLGGIAGPSYGAVDELPEQVLASIAAREYYASAHDHGLQAPNRAQGFRTHFRDDGIELVERDPSALPLMRLSLVQWGRANHLQWVDPGLLVAKEVRVERRSKTLTEWYINRPEGLEHGFDLAAAPPGHGELEFHLESDRPAHRVHADLIEFGSGEKTLRYSKLKVWDANGRILPAHTDVSGTYGVVIRVDDTGAHYPVTIDPLLSRTADIVRNGGQSGAEFGTRIASAGDINNDGVDDLVVGAFRFDSNGLTDNGGAFVYLGPGFTTSTFLSTNQAGAGFGAGVGGAGDVNLDGFDDVVIGVPGFDGTAGNNSGAAFVYFGGVGALDPTVDATIMGPNSSANMGAAVRGVGDVNNDGIDDLAVGVPRYNPGGQSDRGGAFIYYGSASFDTTADAVLNINDVSVNSGNSLASGDVNGDGHGDVIVGATGYESNANLINEGAALVFLGSAGPIDNSADAILRSDRLVPQAAPRSQWAILMVMALVMCSPVRR
ncbi:MAG: FG-GAP repeat protein [Ahniella sp.]|nr:FG-GAP repeat protein [Ahniella sp.]